MSEEPGAGKFIMQKPETQTAAKLPSVMHNIIIESSFNAGRMRN